MFWFVKFGLLCFVLMNLFGFCLFVELLGLLIDDFEFIGILVLLRSGFVVFWFSFLLVLMIGDVFWGLDLYVLWADALLEFGFGVIACDL